MNNPEISIALPSIRPQNLPKVYESILRSTKRTFEMVVVSPFPLPEELKLVSNVKHFVDFGSPVRCNQLAMILSEGKYLYHHSDDGYFFPDALDKNIDLLESMGGDDSNVVVGKYSESKDLSHKERYQDDDYYRIVNAYPCNKEFIPNDWFIFNVALMYQSFFNRLGGFDCSFQCTACAHGDFSIRAYNFGAKVQLSQIPFIMADHDQSDHYTIEFTQGNYDIPRFRDKHKGPLSLLTSCVDINNWKNAEQIWSKRFK